MNANQHVITWSRDQLQLNSMRGQNAGQTHVTSQRENVPQIDYQNIHRYLYNSHSCKEVLCIALPFETLD